MTTAPDVRHALKDAVRQSPPVDLTAPYDTATLAGKTILITGGSSGFGAGMARRWAQNGAHIVIGDVNDAAGEALVAELRASSPADTAAYHQYYHCDVTDWASQVTLFRAAVENSADGTLHAVVPNAGISDKTSPGRGRGFEDPAPPPRHAEDAEVWFDFDADPAPPTLDVVQVNFTGVLYTVHLALYWLQRGEEKERQARERTRTTQTTRTEKTQKTMSTDRHILLVSSMAGLKGLVGQAQYSAAKHGVTGLFRALRSTVHRQGIRINMLCPYFADTGILPTTALLVMAGSGMAQLDDVVEAGTRLMADEAVRGRALAIGPRLPLDDAGEQPSTLVSDRERAWRGIWECYADDFEESDLFMRRYMMSLNALTWIRGWVGVFRDAYRALTTTRGRA